MQNKLINQLTQCLRGSVATFEAFELSLRLIAWAKLSTSSQIDEDLKISLKSEINLSELKRIFERLSENYQAFEDRSDLLSRVNSNEIYAAISVLKNTILTGVIDSIKTIDFIDFNLSMRDSIYSMPSDLAELLVSIAKPGKNESVYIPWDITGVLACCAAEKGANVSLENPAPYLASLNKIISGHNFDIKEGEPIKHPAYVGEGELKKFDIAVSSPPFGLRYEYDVISKDWFGRFNDDDRSGEVLILKHLLAVTNGRVIVAMTNNILFCVGAERRFREDLINRGYVEAIINLPSGLFDYANVNTNVMVLNTNNQQKKIRFVNADIDLFKEPLGRTKNKLKNINLIVEAMQSDINNDYSRTVSFDEIRENNYQLQANRYVLPESALKARDYLKKSKTAKLKNIVEIIRPIIGREQEVGVHVYEVSGVDFPEYGEIMEANRQTILNEDVAEIGLKQFLRPYDIVLMTKGNAGRVGIVGENAPKPGAGGWIAGQSAVVLRLKSKQPKDAKGLFMQLRSPLGQAILKTVISGATIKLIQLRELIELEVISTEDKTFTSAANMLDEESNYQKQIFDLRTEQHGIANKLWIFGESPQ
jgi:type I restriction enzyme M protein